MKNGFDSVIGYSGIKDTLMRVCDSLRSREVYESLGVPAPGGMLLHGVPGVGKTLMATAFIEESGLRSFTCRKNKADEYFVEHIRHIFEQAADEAPCIVFLDDMDKYSNEDECRRNTVEFITVQSCMDDFRDRGVFVLATANDIDNMPDSLLRPGRFDHVIEVPVPSEEDSLRIIEHYLEGKETSADLESEFVSTIMHGSSCAELEAVLNRAGVLAGYERKGRITVDHFIRAYLDRNDEDEYVDDLDEFDFEGGEPDSLNSHIIYHEAGHAVVSEILSPGSVTLVSALRSGSNHGGFVSYKSDRNSVPAVRNRKKILAALAGKAAVEFNFGVPDCGADEDIKQAFNILCHEISFSCTLGFEHLSEKYSHVPESGKVAVRTELESSYRKTQEIIARNREFLYKLASELSKHGYLTYREIQEVRSRCLITPFQV